MLAAMILSMEYLIMRQVLVSLADTDGRVAVDIPIGLPDTGRRRADVQARQAVGGRRSAVFLTPVRAALLAAAGITLTADLGPAGRVAGVDDVLDAAAAAWTARRVAAGHAVSLPSPPETYSDGLPCAIWA